jgi:hypothetical protein
MVRRIGRSTESTMSKYEAKTKPTERPVADFIAAVDDPVRRDDATAIDAMMRRVTSEEPRLWGPSIVGYGHYHYAYASGHEGDAPRIGFSPRKAEMVLYVLSYGDDACDEEEALLARLGKYRRGKSCLYVKRLSGVDTAVLQQLIARRWARMAERYPA